MSQKLYNRCVPWKKISCSKAKYYLTELNINARDFEGLVNNFTKRGDSDDLNDRLLEITQNNLTNLSELLYDGLPDTGLSIKKAKEIMGEDFYGHERYEQVFGRLPDLDELGRVPFKISELRRAKEKGMKLILRYDHHEAVAVPSVADLKRDDLAITLPRNHQDELTQKVRNGWVLVSKLTSEFNYAFRQAGDSLNLAIEILGKEVNSEARNEIFKWQEKIDTAAEHGNREQLMGLLMDLIANKMSEGQRYLVQPSEAIYDAFMVSGAFPKRLHKEIDSVVTGMLIGRRQEPHFLKVHLRDQELAVEAVPVDMSVNRVRYQIRV